MHVCVCACVRVSWHSAGAVEDGNLFLSPDDVRALDAFGDESGEVLTELLETDPEARQPTPPALFSSLLTPSSSIPRTPQEAVAYADALMKVLERITTTDVVGHVLDCMLRLFDGEGAARRNHPASYT